MATIQILVPGQDEPYYLSERDVEGSKTIENLRHYNVNRGLYEPIDIIVPLADWDEYMQFLQHGTPSIGALKIIDYLDNLEQAKTWFWNRYENDINNVYEPEGQILDIIKRNTQFSIQELFPLLSTKNIMDTIPYLNIPHLPQFYIKHVLDYNYDTYLEFNKFPTFSDIPSSLSEQIYNYFIIKPLHQQDMTDDAMTRGINKTSRHIIRYIAQHYPNIRVYADFNIRPSMRENSLLLGPPNKPYLAGYETRQIWAQRSKLDYYWTDDPQLEGKIPPLDVYNPNSNYKPYIGYDTDFTYDGYRIYSYNLPTTNGRDYYLFYNILDDPVIMIKYVISI